MLYIISMLNIFKYLLDNIIVRIKAVIGPCALSVNIVNKMSRRVQTAGVGINTLRFCTTLYSAILESLNGLFINVQIIYIELLIYINRN
jgi:hypothetical protein